jgi:hypothetical protein
MHNRGLTALRYVCYDWRMGKAMADELLLKEVQAVRAELGRNATLERGLQALLHEAASTWQAMVAQGVPQTGRVLLNHHTYGLGQINLPGHGPEALRLLERATTLPNKELRRFAIAVSRIRPMIAPVAKKGPGADVEMLWLILWLDASGMSAPRNAFILSRGKHKPLHRDRIWKLRAAVYKQLAAKLAAQTGIETEKSNSSISTQIAA